MGDLNLSHRVTQDQDKLNALCQDSKFSALKEITRSISKNQLDYILIDKSLRENCFVTSFQNFISDHKSITARVGLDENEFSKDFKVKLTFDKEAHLKSKVTEMVENSDESRRSDEGSSASYIDQSNNEILLSDEEESEDGESESSIQYFRRRFSNIDMSTCWLNSCLQLLLTAMDYSGAHVTFTSELGTEILQLKLDDQSRCLDPSMVKNLLVSTEDFRICSRISELEAEIKDPVHLARQVDVIKSMKLDLYSGQQCVRDFFLCLEENILSWPDVCSSFNFKVTHSTKCSSCENVNTSETTQLYIEIPVPPDNSNLNNFVEKFFNVGEFVNSLCSNCKQIVKVEKKSELTEAIESEFLIIILRRAIETLDGFELVRNRTISTNDVLIR